MLVKNKVSSFTKHNSKSYKIELFYRFKILYISGFISYFNHKALSKNYPDEESLKFYKWLQLIVCNMLV